MKVASSILLALAAALVVIGAHLTMKAGIMASYPLFMFAIVLLFWHMYRKKSSNDADVPKKPDNNRPKARKRNKKK